MEPRSLVTITELAVAEASGVVDDRGDHRVVTTAAQPHFYWGNFLVVPAPIAPNDVDGWIERARAVAAPGVAHVALCLDAVDGVIGPPATVDALTAAGFTLETLIAMTARGPVVAAAPPPGVAIRRFASDDDWQAMRALALAVEPDTPGYADYLDGWIPSRRAAAAVDRVRWWGAFEGDALVASAGVVPLGAIARYQDVMTHPAHRRRGLASAVLAAIDTDERARGAETLVLVVGADNAPARAAYRKLGFVDGDRAVQALRPPAR